MIALVTGGSRGIGAATALALAEAGFDVAITCRSNIEKAREVSAACKEKQVRAEAYQADISREEDCIRLLKEVEESLGVVDVLVNNAGMNQDGLAMRMKTEQFNSVVQTNLTGTFMMCRAVLPGMMKKRTGRIINMTSVAGLHGNAGQVNYAAAKAGVIGLTKTLAKEVASRQITVNAIAPGFVETDMTDRLPEKIREQAKKEIGLGRFGKPEDIAAAVVFLASPRAAYITGQVLEISGGLRL